MVNGDKIRNMTDEQLEVFLRGWANICRFPDYANIISWIKSEDEQMTYIGKNTKYGDKPAIKVGDKTIMGQAYEVLICENQIYKVPKKGKRVMRIGKNR